VILFIFRQEVYAERDELGRLKDSTLEGKAEIIVGKQRNGPIGSVRLFFHKHYTRFDNFANRVETGGPGPAHFPGSNGPKLVRGGPDDY
ncbi:MAG: replicative DNA helicase, partial [Gemmatimonadota bacterium]|nr:replicative DNA helicase [Gemmatimonadota bacterium]